ncbi:ATP-binding protein [Pseudogemmobacter sp. W21_MBD1_M6]|uniref:sensor histidine kinase n=1 Tax=Pseudogemmobacter sp. W21_MBD1_M6 TaxID=3240271 RepID=UPI003F969C6D
MTPDNLESVMAGVPLPMILIGPDERIRAANSLAARKFGGDSVGRHYVTVLRQPTTLDAIEGVLRDGTPRQVKYLGTEARRETTFHVTCSPVAEAGRMGVLLCFEDVTHLEEAGQMRRDFVANVSHELRTPLTALIGFIETLRGAARDDPAARERFLDIMAREADRMNRLVRDLLQLSRVEGEERMRPTSTIDVRALAASAALSLKPVADKQGIAVVLAGEPGPVTLQADSDQMLQVFSNLIENAIKYGGCGGDVIVSITKDPADPSLRGPGVRIDVIDRGPGIDPVHLPRLTERFYRVDGHRSREMGGTGLGLAIVKHSVNRHRGRFRIESTVGQGSCFSIVLPMA